MGAPSKKIDPKTPPSSEPVAATNSKSLITPSTKTSPGEVTMIGLFRGKKIPYHFLYRFVVIYGLDIVFLDGIICADFGKSTNGS